MPSRFDGDLRAQLILRGRELFGDFAVVRIHFGGQLIFGDRFVEPARRREAARAREVILRRRAAWRAAGRFVR